jgi:hypothetical protein
MGKLTTVQSSLPHEGRDCPNIMKLAQRISSASNPAREYQVFTQAASMLVKSGIMGRIEAGEDCTAEITAAALQAVAQTKQA